MRFYPKHSAFVPMFTAIVGIIAASMFAVAIHSLLGWPSLLVILALLIVCSPSCSR